MEESEITRGEKNMNLRIPSHIHKHIKDMALRDGRSLNAEIVYCIKEYLKKDNLEEEKIKLDVIKCEVLEKMILNMCADFAENKQ